MFAPFLTIDLGNLLWDALQMLSVSGLRHLIFLGQDNECLDLISDRQILAEILGALPVCTADGKIT
jgi:hypothetical protein